MASYKAKLPKPRYSNWLKAGLALLITKEGLTDFVYDEIEQFQIKCLADICAKHGLPPNTTCSSCSTVAVLVCPTAGICNRKSGTCTFHNGNYYRMCPNQVCDRLRQAITNAHRYPRPSYKNTDATKWCSSAWEVAKCYMPADGYSHAMTAAETDFNGILSVILNHKSFQSKISDDLSNKRGIFVQAREVGRDIRHSSDLELDTPTLMNYFTILEDLLSDPKFLQHNHKAQTALGMLKQLKSNTLVVRADDLEKVLRDAASVMQNNIVDEADKRKQDILTQVTNALSSLQSKQDNCLDAVTTAMMSATALIQSTAECAEKTVTDLSKTEGDKLSELGSELRAEVTDSIERKRISAEESFEKFATKTITDLSKTEGEKMSELGNKLRTEVHDSIERTRISAKESVEIFATKTVTDQAKTERDKLLDIANKVRTEALHAIEEERTSAENTVQKAATESIKDVTELTENKMKSFIQTAKTEISDISVSEQQKLRDTGHNLIRALEETGGSVIRAVENDNDAEKIAKFREIKKALKEDLIEFNRSEYSTLPLSPLFEENDAPLTEFYVTPTMYVHRSCESPNDHINLKANRRSTDKNKANVKSYKDIFYTNSQMHRNIYVTAPAGIGKTSFANHMTLTWCQSHDNQTTNDAFFQKLDLDALEMFEFLFYLPLRDIRQSNCDIDNMITTHIIDLLPRSYLFNGEFLQRVLYEENHFVVLDGLDEWAPNPQCELCTKNALPHGKIRHKCIRLTTTRPWKLDYLRLNSAKADQHVEIASLSELSVQSDKTATLSGKLANKVISYLNGKFQTSKSVEAFFSLLDEKQLWKVSEVPLIVLQLLCLWYDGEQLGDSQCQIYSNMINLLFERHARGSDVHVNDNTQKLPLCFDSNAECKKYSKLLIKLGKLAFDRLCSFNQEQELVFERTVALNVLDENDLDMCLKIGILTQSKHVDNKLTRRRSNVSFLHKTYQEFLAALYVSNIEDVEETQIAIFKSGFTVPKILGFEMLFTFMAGLNSDIMPVLLRSLVSYISKDKRTEEYRRSVDSSIFLQFSFADDYSYNGLFDDQMRLLKDIQDIVVMCSIECTANKKEILPNLAEDVFFESYNSKEYLFTLKQLVLNNSDNVVSLSCNISVTNETLWAYEILQDILKSITSLQKLSVCHSWSIKCDNVSDSSEYTDSEDDSDIEEIDLEKIKNIFCEEIYQGKIGNVKLDEIEVEEIRTPKFEDIDRKKGRNVAREDIDRSKFKNLSCEETDQQEVDWDETACDSWDIIPGDTASRDTGCDSKCSFIIAFVLNQLLSRSIKTMKSIEINTDYFSCLHFSVRELQEFLEHISNMEEIGQVSLESLHCYGDMERPLDFKTVRLKKLEILNISSMPYMKLKGLQNCHNLKILNVSSGAIKFQIPKNSIQTLIIRKISMSHSSVKRMLKNVSFASELTHIEIDAIECIDHEENCRGFDLTLKSLTQFCEVSLTGLTLTKLQLNEKTITLLEMSDMCMDLKLMGIISELKCIRKLKLKRIAYIGCDFFPSSLCILDLSKLEQLQTLCLKQCDIALKGFGKTRQLRKFEFGEIRYLTHCKIMCKILPTAQTLKEITFTNINEYDFGIPELVLKAVSNLKKLQNIKLAFVSVPENALGFISDMHELEKLEFISVKMSAASFQNLIRSLSQLQQSVDLIHFGSSIEPLEEYKQILEMLRSSDLFEIYEEEEERSSIYDRITKRETGP
ncbi:uncharacterized protein LOC123526543 [Mercenaria mercenaria]|uniref:uncharacterized protein LOC123526543 n=1 Tax=Mercenaria mercenaria TaxID=6596 RepID=UPI00234FB525|nr:uncharacterized protein LOC123526543 [Mercenaria mercenaria]